MPLPIDPETLRIPAFMRKRNLSKRGRKPLMITALDRKRAGVISKKVLPKITPVKARRIAKKIKKIRTSAAPKVSVPHFSAPIFEAPIVQAPQPAAGAKKKSRGIVTHYYEKIKVGVIKLNQRLEIGDTIKYETDDGHYDQLVESMEINRAPVFSAEPGDEIGLKLERKPRLGSKVL